MKVFYLEQNDMGRKSLELALSAKGVEVYTAAPEDDFEHILGDWGADLLLIDFESVKGDLVRYTSTQIPVVVTVENGCEVEGVEVIQKPFNPVEVAGELLEKFNN